MTQKIRVLMVDDEEKFRATVGKILRRRGFETTMAGTGEEALAILTEKPHDVVVLDIKMPGMDGHEALARIREIRPRARVIMLTGHGNEQSAHQALKQGAFDYLNKPCDIDLLAAKINNAYTTRAQAGALRGEKTAGDIMIHVADYTTISQDQTVKEAMEQLLLSFEGFISSSRVMETGHRSILVFDDQNQLVGLLSIQDLIAACRPAYLSAPKPSMADSMQYSAMFWTGLFTAQVQNMADKKVADIMSDSPPFVSDDTNLMELANLMHGERIRRVVVRDGSGNVVGVVREQELFFEMAEIILKRAI